MAPLDCGMLRVLLAHESFLIRLQLKFYVAVSSRQTTISLLYPFDAFIMQHKAPQGMMPKISVKSCSGYLLIENETYERAKFYFDLTYH